MARRVCPCGRHIPLGATRCDDCAPHYFKRIANRGDGADPPRLPSSTYGALDDSYMATVQRLIDERWWETLCFDPSDHALLARFEHQTEDAPSYTLYRLVHFSKVIVRGNRRLPGFSKVVTPPPEPRGKPIWGERPLAGFSKVQIGPYRSAPGGKKRRKKFPVDTTERSDLV